VSAGAPRGDRNWQLLATPGSPLARGWRAICDAPGRPQGEGRHRFAFRAGPRQWTRPSPMSALWAGPGR